MNKISLYGSSGFIGSKFAEMFSNDIITIDREDRSPKSSEILYLISTTHNYNVFNNPELDVKTNLNVLCEVFEKIKNVDDLVFNFVSSWYVYGEYRGFSFKEGDEKRPLGFYSITKSCAEDLLISFCKTYNLKYRIFRLGSVFGKNDKGSSDKKNVLSHIIEKIAKDEEIEVYYNGEFTRDYIHINDVCRAMMHLVKFGKVNEIYNIATGTSTKFIDIITYCYEQLNKDKKIKFYDLPKYHDVFHIKNSDINISKLFYSGFNIKENLSIYDGVKEILSSKLG